VKNAADLSARAHRVETMVGRSSTLYSPQRLQSSYPGIAAAVGALEDRLGHQEPAPGEEPLFIFSAGWRSGSTLLQRLVVSADRHFIWAEPYHRTDSLRRLAESLLPFGTGWPPAEYVHGADGEGSGVVDLSNQSAAAFNSSVSRLIDAHRAFVRELLAPPPARAELRWGLEEVRLSAEYGLYLRLLFPRARFLFLVRDPHAAYHSYTARPTLFERWPRSQIRSPYSYGRLWRRLAESFVAYEQTLDAMLVRYEDLVPDSVAIDKLDELLGAPVDRSVLHQEIKGKGSPGSRDRSLSPLEVTMLDRATHPLASRLGYSVG
jgi:hypothetical protein